MRPPKSLFAIACIFFLGQSLQAQWLPNGTSIYYQGGFVGIGNTAPRSKLDIWAGSISVTGTDVNGTLVAGSGGGNAYLGCNALTNGVSISPSGHVGIGTLNPSSSYNLDVVGFAKADGIDINNGNVDGGRLIFRSQGYPEWRVRNINGLGFFPGEGQPTSLWLDNSGSIGVGVQDTHGYKFAVNGSAVFTKVVVKATSSNFPDYVFHNNYRLRPLSEVEEYIRQNHHLPEVPSAEEVGKNGLDVGDNQAALLKKVEELTLYVIELNKQIQELKAKEKSRALKEK
jgi:hypothetical protein